MARLTVTTYTWRYSKFSLDELDKVISRFMHQERYLHNREKLEQRVFYRIQYPATAAELVEICLAEKAIDFSSIGIGEGVYQTSVSYGTLPGIELFLRPAEEQRFISDTLSRITSELAKAETPTEYWAAHDRLSYKEVKAIVERTLLEFTSDKLPLFERYRCETVQVGDAWAYIMYCYFEDIEFSFAKISVYPMGEDSWGMTESRVESEEARWQLTERLIQKLDKLPYSQRPKSFELPHFYDKLNSLCQTIHRNLAEAAKHKHPHMHRSKRGKSRYSEADRRKVVLDWEAIDPNDNPIMLEEFLEQRFGSEGGILKVSPSTFYSWREKVLKTRK